MVTERILDVAYHSCSVVLEVNATWSERGYQRELVLARLSDKAMYNIDLAHEEVMPFVEAVKRAEPRAIAEVRRALMAQHAKRTLVSDHVSALAYRHTDADCLYDPEEFNA